MLSKSLIFLKRIFILIICILFVVKSYGQNKKYLSPKFQNIALKEGLSNLSIQTITQDHLGYIWLGTARGLNRYDGINFKHFFYRQNDTTTLYHDNISLLHTSFDGKVFISTRGGVNIYDPLKEEMQRVLSKIVCRSFICCLKNTYAVSNRGKLHLYNDQNLSFEPVNDIPANINLDDAISDQNGNIWAKIIDNDFLIRYNPEKKLYEKYSTPDRIPFTVNDVMTIVGDQLLIATSNKTYQFCTQRNQFITLNEKFRQIENIDVNDINFIKEIEHGKIWIGTKKSGLYILNEQQNELINYNIKTLNNYLPINHIISIFKDCDNNVWLGTDGKGLEVAFYRRKNFNFGLTLNELIGEKSIISIASDFKGTYFFGTRYDGVLIFNHINHTGRFLHKDNSFLTDNHIRSLYFSSNNKLWINTHSNTFILDFESSIHQEIDLPKTNRLVCMHEVEGTIFAGSDQRGLLKFNLNGQLIKQINDFGNNITHIVQKDETTLLFSSFGRGLYEYDLLKDSIIKLSDKYNLSSINDKRILNMYIDSQNQLWASGFRFGLFNISFEKDTVVAYTTDNGLPSNDITGITEDQFGNIWISTAYGLSKFDNVKQFTNYSYNEGLDIIQFHQKATLRDEKGTIFFGGNFGLTYFNPINFGQEKNKPPAIILDKLNVGNQSVIPSDETEILEKTLAKTTSITLNHKHSVFSIDYKGFDYVSAKNLKYAYFLEGFDDDWNYVDHRTRASYTNLKPDEYVFHVKAQNNYGDWSKTPATLSIKVKPAPWLTIWAMSGYMLSVGLLLMLAYKITLKASIMKRKLDLEQKEHLREQEMSVMKLRFFTNISHELRTPLTLIKGNVDYLTKETKAMNLHLRSVKSLQNSTDRLLRLVNQILSFRQLENDALDLKIKEENIIQISEELIESFKYNCEFKQVHLSLDTDFETLTFPIDRDKYEKILCNLINNSLKFAEQEGNIIVSIKTISNENAISEYQIGNSTSDYVQISVIDDGKGISEEKIPYIFDRYTQFNDNDYKQDYGGTGIGLNFTKRLLELHHGAINVSSNPEISTIFSFILPLDVKAYNQKVIIEPEEVNNISEHSQNNYSSELYQDETTLEETDKKTILLAEDDVELNHFITQSLSDKFKVIRTFNGAEALILAKNQMPDIIISDIMMPKMDGIELCKTIKEDNLISHIPIVLLTAKTDIENKLIGYKFGADEYITKPFDIEVLKARVINLIVQRKKLQEFYFKAAPLHIKTEQVNPFEINFMNQVNSVIDKNYKNSEFNIHLLAENMNMSRTNFYRKFLNITDVSPKEYLTKFRLNKAIELIHKGTDNFGDISFMCGFNNQSIFSVSFKREKGITPLQYKKSL